jgi:hypothetical protein
MDGMSAMTYEQTGPGTFTCRECGHVIQADAATAAVIEQLLAHTHERHPDDHHPAIWLR